MPHNRPMGPFRAAFVLQLRLIAADPNYLLPLLTAPMFTVIFVAIVKQANRADLAGYALLAPVLIALWQLSLLDSGEILAEERWLGTLEPALAAPTAFPLLVFARIVAVTSVALVSIPEVFVVGWGLFGVSLTIAHPLTLALALAATAFAMSCTAVIMAALFVLTRSARTFQNALSYPFYVLGGVMVPVAFLPSWLRPLSSIVFLSWAADLARDALSPQPVHRLIVRLVIICGLGVAGLVIGSALLRSVINSVRTNGTVGAA